MVILVIFIKIIKFACIQMLKPRFSLIFPKHFPGAVYKQSYHLLELSTQCCSYPLIKDTVYNIFSKPFKFIK